jgi:hypothetical protein
MRSFVFNAKTGRQVESANAALPGGGFWQNPARKRDSSSAASKPGKNVAIVFTGNLRPNVLSSSASAPCLPGSSRSCSSW